MTEDGKDSGNQEQFKSVRRNEPVFRQVLADVKKRFPDEVPSALDPSGDIDNIISEFFTPPIGSNGFGIGEFEVGPEENFSEQEVYTKLHSVPLKENEAVIEIHNFGLLSGINHILGYAIDDKGKVEFKGEVPGVTIMS